MALLLGSLTAACGADDTGADGGGGAAGAATVGSGGMSQGPGMGGAAQGGNSNGPATGGASNPSAGSGGSSSGAGGANVAAGGSGASNGGSENGSGGAFNSAGGRSSAGGSGGAAPSGGNGAGGRGGNGSGGASSSAGGSKATGGSSSGGSGSGSGGSATGGASGGNGKVFSQCRFHFGTIDSKAKNDPALIQQLDMFTPGWIGQADSFDMKYACDEAANPFGGLVPAMVSYIIAFTARRDQGLQDCNVSGNTNLCKYGATYIRAHRDRILNQYAVYAKGFANTCGTTKPLLWLMEPDFYQYSVGGDAQALSAKEAGDLMTQIVTIVKQNLPNAVFSLDVSPWMPNNGRDWYSNFNLSLFTFINTSGGGTDANNSKIRSNNGMTWAGVHQVTGKPILADTGYGAAGASAGHDGNWDIVANLNARIADGVMSISQYNPNPNWASTIQQIRPQLSTSVPCL